MKRSSIAVLFSGGLDSAALAAHYLSRKKTVVPVYVRAGLRWEKAELFWIQKFLKRMRSPLLKPLQPVSLVLEKAYRDNWSTTGKTPGVRSSDAAVFLPARNLLLTTKACMTVCPDGVTTLALGTLSGNPFCDGKRIFFDALENVLSWSFNQKIRIETPFRDLNKSQIIRANKNFPLELSLSCISPVGYIHCGRCNKCAERKRAFKEAGVEDRTQYRRS